VRGRGNAPPPGERAALFGWTGSRYVWLVPLRDGLVPTSQADGSIRWAPPTGGGGGGGGAVASVFGRTGTVTALSTDYAAHYQPLGSDLTALEALASTGLAARTAANTWALRAVTGTTDEILVTNGAGTGGNPTVGLASNPTVPGFGGLVLPIGTTGQRGASTAGRLRASTTLGVLEYYSGAAWEQLASEAYVTTAGAALVTGARRLALFGGL
jgi:hypothetical protein